MISPDEKIIPIAKTIKHKWLQSCLLVVLIAAILLLFYKNFIYNYLAYSDKPEPADVIVLFLGPEPIDRCKEALQLIHKNRARYIIIASHGCILKNELGSHISVKDIMFSCRNNHDFINNSGYPQFYERTHIETLTAKSIMSSRRFKKGIFVSSPLHMRRIKLIAERVFKDKQVKIVYTPTRFVRQNQNDLINLSASDWHWIATEYIKMAWYLTYSSIVRE